MKLFALLLGALILSAAVLEAQEKEAVKAPAAAAEVKTQTKCPIMGGAVNKKLYVDQDGTRIYVCCGGCIEPLKKDFPAMKAKLEKEGVTLDKTPAAMPGKDAGADAGRKDSCCG